MTNNGVGTAVARDLDQPTSFFTERSSVAVVGLGYVGLPTALALTDQATSVVGLEASESRLSAVKAARVDLQPRDRQRLRRALDAGLLKLTTEPTDLASADTVVICVPTPIDAHLTPDLTALRSACATVVEQARVGQLIVLTSTTYPGCTVDLLVTPLTMRGFAIGRDICVAFSPERIDPGVAEHAPEHTPRVVGGVTTECSARAVKVLTHTAESIHVVSSPEAAEMTKLLENSFRAVNIALANEFADAARELRIDIMEVISAAATKPYGFMPFYPGAGVGGHCIPCDPHYLIWQLRSRRAALPVIEAAMTAIAARPREVVVHARRILADRGSSLSGARVLVVGVAYKPGVADVRESPAIAIIDMLAAEGATVRYTDQHIDMVETPAAGQLFHLPDPAAELWDLVVVHTVHPAQDHRWLSNQPAVLDTTYRVKDMPSNHEL